jgi:hypothetical protein
MSILDQLVEAIDETEFSDKVKDKVKELSVKAKLRREAGQKEEDCLTREEMEELASLIKADMVSDGLKIKACQAYLEEFDKIIAESTE